MSAFRSSKVDSSVFSATWALHRGGENELRKLLRRLCLVELVDAIVVVKMDQETWVWTRGNYLW